jgi:hypothetical protein
MQLSLEEQSEIRSRLLVKWSLSGIKSIAKMRLIVRDESYNTTTYPGELIVDMITNRPIVNIHNRMYSGHVFDDVFEYLRKKENIPSYRNFTNEYIQYPMVINYFEAVWTQYQQWLKK